MTTIDWPSSLPDHVERNNFESGPAAPTKRTEMETGPPKQRRRYSGKWTQSPVSWMMSGSQVDTFEDFFDTTLQGGALKFNWPHPRDTGSTVVAAIVGGDEKPYTLRNLGGDNWRVACTMEWFE